MKIFVITETSFEYNDEYYYEGEGTGGKPVLAFSTLEKAQTALADKTRQWLISTNDSEGLISYGEEPILDVNKFSTLSGIDHNEIQSAWDDFDESAISNMVKNNIDAVLESLELTPFRITEIELADKSAASA